MRLWHKDLIPYLPKQQLLGQWRECCLIAKNIKEKGIPGHLLVNKIMNYPIQHFITYSALIADEMEARKYSVDRSKFQLYTEGPDTILHKWISMSELFKGWHNDRYLLQCYHNLQEKFDCEGITQEEWKRIADLVFPPEIYG